MREVAPKRRNSLCRRMVVWMMTAVLLFVMGSPCVTAEEDALKLTETISIRDPYVLVFEGKYYMYGTGAAPHKGYGCYVSEDLAHWEGPYQVFAAPKDYDGVQQFWAPECHRYQDAFYLFATYYSASTEHRGLSVYRAESPLGPFAEISDGHITPHSRDCIDGTLYVDPDGQPWMVYVEEWTSEPDGNGGMAAVRLTPDLSAFAGTPKTLFHAKDIPFGDSGVTDGPFLYRTSTGRLLMLWSTFCNKQYCVRIARALDGTVDGRWVQEPRALYRKTPTRMDGGHPMLFTDVDGRLLLSFHSPNHATEDTPSHAVFLPVRDVGTTLRLQGEERRIATRCYDVYCDILRLLRRGGQ